jgi:opacity protein-like surface antigen
MLKKILKIVLLTPVLMAGVSFASRAFSEEKQVKPNIHLLTNEKSAQKASNGESYDSSEIIPGEIHKHSLGVGVGQTFLRSDLADNGNDKITADLYYNYSASHSFDFVANAHYSEHSYLNREATIRGLALAIKGKGFQFDAFSPFVLGGFGFYLPSANRIQNGVPTETRKQLVFGVNVGAGVELRLNRDITIGVIAHYHDPFDVRQDSGPKLEGSYMKLLILAFYTFN